MLSELNWGLGKCAPHHLLEGLRQLHMHTPLSCDFSRTQESLPGQALTPTPPLLHSSPQVPAQGTQDEHLD